MNRLDTLEERIQKPGYLLFLVTFLLLLIIGFVNLISHQGEGTTVLGLYSIRQAVVIVVYFAAMIGWASLLWKPNNDRWLHRLLDWIIARPAAVFGLLAVYGLLGWNMMTHYYWLFFPALQAAVLIAMVIFLGLVLLHRWDSSGRTPAWRRILVYAFGAVIAVEVVLQLLAAASLLPTLDTTISTFSPYDRIYYAGPDHTTNTIANRYGYNYPEFRLADDSRRILLLGDRVVQGLNVAKDEHLGLLLERQIAVWEGSLETPSEVLPIAHPDYGPGIYLNVPLFELWEEEFEPDEVIIFFDLANDFQLVTASDGRNVFFYPEGDSINLSEDDFWLRHDQLHTALWGLDGFQPRRTLYSHYLTGRVAEQLFSSDVAVASALIPAPQEDLPLPNSFAFYAETSVEPLYLATSHVRLFQDYAQAQGIAVHLVTIPVFSDNFYEQGETAAWTTRFGEADLFLPEQALRAFAAENDIPFLAMGEYLRQAGLTPAEIQALYAADGQLNAAGHELFATAAFECFYAGRLDESAGCDLAP